jgi:hypothetical protein
LSKSIKDALDISQDVVVPEPNDVISGFLQAPRSHSIFRDPLCVLPSVDFNNQLQIQGDEIDDVAANWLLPFEFEVHESLIAELAPHQLFGIGHLASKHAREFTHIAPPHPTLSPKGRGLQSHFLSPILA